jgi:predicted nucleic acid-binding protein
MAEQIVINTGPLIVLSRIEALDIVGHLPYRFICPDAVRLELDKGESAGHPRIAPTWLQVIPVATAPSPIILAALDLGEAAVIHLALEQKVQIVCIDEWKGRRAALASGLKVTGVLGLLARAKSVGIIQEMTPFVEKALRSGVRYHPDLVRRVLEMVKE